MAEPKQILRLTESPATPGDVAAPGAGEPVVQGDLSRVVEQLQTRLASLEKRRAAAARKKPAAPSQAAPVPASPEALEARLREFRELEAALQIEKLSLHTRLRAAEQEELLLRNESQTLQLKLKSFRVQTQKLRAEEAELSRRAEEIQRASEQAATERQQIEQARHELQQLRQQLDRDHPAVAAESAAARSLSAPAVAPASAAPASGSALAAALIILALAAVAGLAVSLTWLTVEPVYRASATLASGSPFGPNPAALFDDPILEESLSLLRQRGLRPFGTAAELADQLRQHMTLTPGINPGITPGIAPGVTAGITAPPAAAPAHRMTLTLDAPLREQAIFILEALTRTYAKAHAADGAVITHAAAADLLPVKDDRPRIALIGFAIGTGVLALLVALLRLLRRPSPAR